MARCAWITLAVAVSVPLLISLSLKEDQPFFLKSSHNQIANPAAHHSRYRRPDYLAKNPNRFFFQWWNFLIYDGETHDHFNFIYNTLNFASGSDEAIVAMGHLKGSKKVDAVTETIPLKQVKVSNAYDLAYETRGKVAHTLTTAADGSSWRITGDFPAELSANEQPVSWDVTFHRVHGLYMNEDTEKDNEGDLCTIVSTLFGYNAEVEGWVQVGTKKYTFVRSPRYRSYNAGSWGCSLPSGEPPMDYPWTWFWLIVPNTDPAKDIGLCFGSAGFQTNSVIGDIYGGYHIAGVGKEITSSRLAYFRHNQPPRLPLLGSSSDGYLSYFNVSYDDWADFKDAAGTARIPLHQHYHVRTKTREFVVDWRSKVEQYFRAPVYVEKDGKPITFSDFRAVGVDAHVLIKNRGENGAADVIVYEGDVNTMNSLEFAYRPPVDEVLVKSAKFFLDP